MPQKKFSRGAVEQWSVEEVSNWLTSVKLDGCRGYYSSEGIDGIRLLQLTNDDIKEMPCNLSNEKRRKLMKKAISCLSGNSVSKPASAPKQGKKFNLAGGKSRAKSPSQPPPPSQQHTQPSHLYRSENFAPPLQAKFGLPPRSVAAVDMTYMDPTETFGVAEDGGGGGGIYDRVDDLEFGGNGFTSPFAPPPPDYPPNIGDPPPPDYPPDQDGYTDELYEEGLDLEVDSFSSEDPDDEYESPFEDDPAFLQPQRSPAPTRGGSDTHRAIEAKFYVHGFTQHNTIKTEGSNPADYEVEEEGGEPDEIYDLPPPIANEDDNGIMEDIYDVPPSDEVMAQAKFGAAVIGQSGKAPAPPPPLAPPPDEYDDGGGVGEGVETDEVYDIPSEVLEEAMAGGKAPPPPPPDTPPPIDEDIYDIADLEEQAPPPPSTFPARPLKSTVAPATGGGGFMRPLLKKPIGSPRPVRAASPPPPVCEPPRPGRPPKAPGGGRTPPPRPRTPELPPEMNPQQPPFTRVQLRPPIKTQPGGTGVSGSSSSSAAAAPPPRPSANSKPALPSMSSSGGGTEKSPSLQEAMAKFGKTSSSSSSPPQFGRPSGTSRLASSPPPPPPSKPSPSSGRKYPAKPSEMKSFNTPSIREPKTKFGTPPQGGGITSKFNKPPTTTTTAPAVSNNTSNGFANKPNDLRNKSKPPTAPKAGRITALMNQFQTKNPQQDGENKGTSTSETDSRPLAHKSSRLAAPEKPSGDFSPLSGRRMDRKDSVGDLRSKFERNVTDRPGSPAGGDSRGSPSPNTPSLPPKPAVAAAAWQHKPVPPTGASGPALPRGRPKAGPEELPPPVERTNKPWQQQQQREAANVPEEPPPPPPSSVLSRFQRKVEEPPQVERTNKPWQQKQQQQQQQQQKEAPSILEEPPPPSRFNRRAAEEPPQVERTNKPWQQQKQQPQQQKEAPSIPEEPPPPSRFNRRAAEEPPQVERTNKPWQQQKQQPQQRDALAIPEEPPPPSRFTKKVEEPKPSSSPRVDRKAKPISPRPVRKKEAPPSPSFGRRKEEVTPPDRQASPPQLSRKGREEPSSPQSARRTESPITPDGDLKRAFQYRPYSRRQSDAALPAPPIEEEPAPPSRLPPKPATTVAATEPEVTRPPDRPPLKPVAVVPNPLRLPPARFPPPAADPVTAEPLPKLPSRPPPQTRPLPTQVSEPEVPVRPWQSKAAVEEEPQLPARPPKPGPVTAGSPRGKTWYHYTLDRKKAEAKLRKYSKNGTFIVRDSTRVKGEYSLSLWYSEGTRHLRIRLREDDKFVLGESKEDEVAFDAVDELVEYHKKEPLHLKSGGETTLKYECPQ